VGELLQAQPRGQCQFTDRAVARQLAAVVAGIKDTVRCQTPQPVEEQRGEVRFQVLDRDVRLRCPAHRQVHPHLAAGAVEQCPRGPVGERFGLRQPRWR
jgi:hypothetical protein